MMASSLNAAARFLVRWTLVVLCVGEVAAQPPARDRSVGADSETGLFVKTFCVDCHNREEARGELDLETAILKDVSENTDIWEKVVRKLLARQMPPLDAPRPDSSVYDSQLNALVTSLDQLAVANPNPGRTETFRRLTRIEYQNAIRDLLDLEIDVASLLPADEPSHGFDNVTVGTLSPTLVDRYLSGAQKISRIAVGRGSRTPEGDTFRIRADVTQEDHVEGLPLGTRGGTAIPYTFPQDGIYEVQVRLARDRNEEVEGLTESHELEVLLDRKLVKSFTVAPPPGRKDFQSVDANLKARFSVTGGPHQLGVTFVKNPMSLLETRRQPYQAHFNMHRHPRISPAIFQVSITGPFEVTGASETPSRRRVFISRPAQPSENTACAKEILSKLAKRAYRRPINEDDLAAPLQLFEEYQADGFEAGIEMALSAILVNPNFLFRIEEPPPTVAVETPYKISDVQLASRLSFFLWSSIPDDTLLEAATRGELSDPQSLEREVRRMLADPRSKSLVTNFADQWLHLRNLESITPDLRLFPDFDHNLRQAFRQETELLFEEVLRDDRSVLDLLKSDHTYLNERLAKHYGVPHIYGNRMRLVADLEEDHRGGLLRHGSILTVTSYATRTSPVIRGKWILENLLGTPPPPPPADVPALKDNTVAANLSVRARLAEHRANAACVSCHRLMDPVGFSLENFDAVGRWRNVEDGTAVDATGGLPDGREFDGIRGLENALHERPELFVQTMTEKLMTFALGRGIEAFDGPAIREIVRQAQKQEYRFSSLILGIAASPPFQMRKTE